MIRENDNSNEFIWFQKYRPITIEECVLPEKLKQDFRDIVLQGRVPNAVFCGTAGTGKSTVAKALCHDVGADYIFINASKESGIDMLRNKVTSFASTVSLSGSKKVVILDEADYLASTAQPALRGLIEEFSNNCSFILTCNYRHRIIPEIFSRCPPIEFKVDNVDKVDVMKKFFARACYILETEKIQYDKKVVAELINKHFPDFRRVIGELQKYSLSGKIDSGILINLSDESYKELFKLIKGKNFTESRKWVGKNSDLDSTVLYRQLYDKGSEIIENESLPQLVLILADYSYKASFVADKEINTMACLVEIMGSCRFK